MFKLNKKEEVNQELFSYIKLDGGKYFSERDFEELDKEEKNKFIKEVKEFGESTIVVNGVLVSGKYFEAKIDYDAYNEVKMMMLSQNVGVTYNTIIPCKLL